MDNKLLEVKNLQVSIKTYRGEVQAVRDVSFSIEKVKCSVSWESLDAEKCDSTDIDEAESFTADND